MNFLAHLYLSGSNEEIKIGNFIGDFMKGSTFRSLSTKLQKGVLLHREIDSFTDSHPIVRQSKQRLQPDYRHYSGVIVDVFHDHFLAANWRQYSYVPLLEYTENFYELTEKWIHVFPEKARYMLKYMKAGNWLYNYQHVEGVDRALTGMSRRTKFESGMDRAAKNLTTHYKSFEEEFKLFFPELVAHSSQYLNSLK